MSPLVLTEKEIQVASETTESVVLVTETETQVVSLGVEGPQGPPSDGFVYVHDQALPEAIWTIEHNLSGFPNVTTVDSADSQVIGDVSYPDADTVVVTFAAGFSGRAFLS